MGIENWREHYGIGWLLNGRYCIGFITACRIELGRGFLEDDWQLIN